MPCDQARIATSTTTGTNHQLISGFQSPRCTHHGSAFARRVLKVPDRGRTAARAPSATRAAVDTFPMERRSNEWLSDRAVGLWFAFAFLGMPAAFGVGVLVAHLLGVAEDVPVFVASLLALGLGIKFILRPQPQAAPAPSAPSKTVQRKALRAAGICAGICFGVARVHGWIGGLGALGFWVATPFVGYLAGRRGLRSLAPEERQEAGLFLRQTVYSVRWTRRGWSWYVKWTVLGVLAVSLALVVAAAITSLFD